VPSGAARASSGGSGSAAKHARVLTANHVFVQRTWYQYKWFRGIPPPETGNLVAGLCANSFRNPPNRREVFCQDVPPRQQQAPPPCVARNSHRGGGHVTPASRTPRSPTHAHERFTLTYRFIFFHCCSSHRYGYYASSWAVCEGTDGFPRHGEPASFVETRIRNYSLLDFKPQLNTASYINVVAEPEEQAVALAGLAVNLADQTVYPGSLKW